MLGYQEFVTAIEKHQIVTFWYDARQRTVEPHIIGYDASGDLTLSAWQLSGTGQGWRNFHVSKLTGLATTGGNFSGTRPGYNRNDPSFHRILARL